MLTYQEQLDLVNRKLATVKVNGNLSTFKYARKVMFDYLWNQHPECMECRGPTYDNTTGKLVVAAPRKSFNYLENAWWSKVPLETHVRMYKKINGYMACASMHNGELIVSTTGTTTSEYAQWAREYIEQQTNHKYIIPKNSTYLYEIVHPNDPHIVKEREGLHYLGKRDNITGKFLPGMIQEMYQIGGLTLQDAINYAQTDRGEGFMLYTQDADGNFSETCKLKTPYYVGKKKLMRMSKANVHFMFNSPTATIASLPSMFEIVVRAILDSSTLEMWTHTPEQYRRKFIESIIGE